MIEASCHCGAIRFTVARAPESVTDCNCSLCRRYGMLWAYYEPGEVRFPAELAPMDTYGWGAQTQQFHRCAQCGCFTHSIRNATGEIIGINARLLEPEILAQARIRRLDGAVTKQYLDP